MHEYMFSCVWLCATSWTVDCQASLSMVFPMQEYWNGLPFPSPGDLPDPGIEPESLALQADSLPSESPGKPKNSGGGNLSLLQEIFLTQEWNWGLLHCRQIFYQLSYQGRPCKVFTTTLIFQMRMKVQKHSIKYQRNTVNEYWVWMLI